MTPTEMLAAARNALAAGLPDGCIDTAARVHADASASADERAQAAILAARGALAKGLWSDALVWCDKAGGREVEAATYRGWAHARRGENDIALEVLAKAVGPGAPADAGWYRAQVFEVAERRGDAYAALATIIDDAQLGEAALRQRGAWRLEDGNRGEGIADLVEAARRGDEHAAVRLHEEDALPDEPEVKLAWACSLAHDDAEEANKQLDKLLKRKTLAPEVRAKVLAKRAVCATLVDEFEEAAGFYKAAVALAPDDRALLVEYGRALYDADEYDDALAVLERARAMQATDADGQLDAKIEAALGDLHFVEKRRAKAVEHYQRSLERCPRQPDIMSRCAHSLEDVKKKKDAKALRFSAAVAGDEQAIEACEQDELELPAQLHDNGTFGLANSGDPDVVAETLGRAAELWLGETRAPGDFCSRHAAMALSNQSYALALAERREEAVESARRAVEMRPGFRDGWNNYGNQLAAVGRHDEALAAFERAAWCDPSYAGAFYGKADVLRRMGDGEGTVAALVRAAEIGYDDPRRQRDIHFRLARAYQALGKLDDAEREWRRMAELDDGDETAADAVAEIAKLASKAAKPKQRPPYRRYGLKPTTWHLGASVAARLQLATDPTAAVRKKLAAAIEEAIVDAEELSPDEPVFSGRFVEITVETDPDGDFPESAFAALEAAADAVHAISPLVEVVGYNAIGLSEDDPGEQWSIATQPVPDTGPEPAYHVAFWPFAFGPQVTRDGD